MNILIATDGGLPVERTVEHVSRLYRTGDRITVMTAVNLPRRLLAQLSVVGDAGGAGPSIADIVEAAGPGHGGLAGGDRVAAQLARRQGHPPPPMEELLERYRAEVAATWLQPMVDGLGDAGVEATRLVCETDNRTAATIIEACRDRKADLLLIGATGRGRFEGLVGSTGVKLMRHAPCDVMLVRVPTPSHLRE